MNLNPFDFLPLIFTVIIVAWALWFANWFLIEQHKNLDGEKKFTRRLIILALSFLGFLFIIFSLPLPEGSRNQLIGLIGIVLSGVLAFSSSTIIANLASGVLLRVTQPFKIGDFIRVGEYFGRVSERGLFDTEIQSETREFITIPNSYCMNNPVTTIKSCGTIISATLSLGYDLDHSKVESLLIKAAEKVELEDPFVHILELGNFAVTYRISAFLTESKFFISAQSKLHGSVLEVLHANGVEIMSPTYMNQRQIKDISKVIPPITIKKSSKEPNRVEDIAFDKANQAEELANEQKELSTEIELIETQIKETDDKEKKEKLENILELLKERLKVSKAKSEEGKNQD